MADFEIIPLTAHPSQEFTVTLGGQNCRIKLYAKEIQVPVWYPGTIVTDPPVFEAATPMFLDLYVNDVLIVGGVRCLADVKIVRDSYLGFAGELSFIDAANQGEPPEVDGLGTRWLLVYWPDL